MSDPKDPTPQNAATDEQLAAKTHYGDRNASWDEQDRDDKDWGKKSSLSPMELERLQEQALKEARVAPSYLFVGVVLLFVVAAIAGYVRASGLDASLDASAIQAQLALWSGSLGSDPSALTVAIWHGLSGVAGAFSYALAIFANHFYAVGKGSRWGAGAGTSASSAHGKSRPVVPRTPLLMLDFIKGEVFKYAIMVVCLGLIFKFTLLLQPVVIISFVVIIFFDMVYSAIRAARYVNRNTGVRY